MGPLILGNLTSRYLIDAGFQKEDLPLHGQTETVDYLGHVLLVPSHKQIWLIPYRHPRKFNGKESINIILLELC